MAFVNGGVFFGGEKSVIGMEMHNTKNGQMQGKNLVYTAKTMINDGVVDYSNYIVLPNIMDYSGSGSFHTHILFVHEDAADKFPKSSYDIKVVIPHHDQNWSSDAAEKYAEEYFESHAELIA